MLNQEYTAALMNLANTNSDLYHTVDLHSAETMKELSTMSHTMRNMLSFLNCSYQFMTELHPETAEFEYWEDIQATLTELIDYTTRTSSYRYTFHKPAFASMNLTELMRSLPETMETSAEESRFIAPNVHYRFWDFDLDPSIHFITSDKLQLRNAFMELLMNALDFSTEDTPIHLITKRLDENAVEITISYASDSVKNLHEYGVTKLISPFFTTQPAHAGLGLSIVNNICVALQGSFTLKEAQGMIVNTIQLPININTNALPPL